MARGGVSSRGSRGSVSSRSSRSSRSATRSVSRSTKRNKSGKEIADFSRTESDIAGDLMQAAPGSTRVGRLAKLIKNKQAKRLRKQATNSEEVEIRNEINIISEARVRDNYMEIGIYQDTSGVTRDGIFSAMNEYGKYSVANEVGPELSRGILRNASRDELFDIAVRSTQANFDDIGESVRSLIDLAQNIRDGLNAVNNNNN